MKSVLLQLIVQGEKIIINKDYINKNLDNLVKDTDLSKFIL
jgi:ATP-dependent HslUV protease ATP-binding subunit HslU